MTEERTESDLGPGSASRRGPASVLRRLIDRIDGALGESPGVEAGLGVSDLVGGVDVDVIDDGGELVVVADVPGSDEESITVEGDGTYLRVEAERVDADADYLRRERGTSLSREVSLPVAFETDGADATYREGVLRVRLPKADDARGEEIEVD